jgi:hypothetical protein
MQATTPHSGFGVDYVTTNPRGAGRPRAPEQIAPDEGKAAKVGKVCDLIRELGFRSFGEFLLEFFNNTAPEVKRRRTKFYNSPSAEDVMATILTDKHAGQRQVTWQCLQDWALQRSDDEASNLLKKPELKELLRHKERVSHGGLEANKKPASISEFQDAISSECPFIWSIFCKISQTAKEKATATNHESSFVQLSSIMALLHRRNQQVNAFAAQMSVFYYAHNTQKRAMEMLHQQGLVLSYSWVVQTLKELAKNNQQRMKIMVQNAPHMISIDNVNRKIGVRDASLTSKPYMV